MTRASPEQSLEDHLEAIKQLPIVGDRAMSEQAVTYLFKHNSILPYGYDRSSKKIIVAVDKAKHSTMQLNDLLVRVNEFPQLITKEMREDGASHHKVDILYLDHAIMTQLFDYVVNPGKISQYFDDQKKAFKLEQGLYDETSEANRIIDSVIKYAIRNRASDIHFEAEGSEFRVRIRVDGELREYPSLIPKEKYPAVISSIKIRSDLDIGERRRPQDGRIAVNPLILKEGKISSNYDLRVSITPTVTEFENAVLRIAERGAFKSLDELGFSSEVYEQVKDLCQEPYGLMLVTGPTGSGKTTTLYGMINELNTTDRKIITIEDPVEIRMNGVQQMQIKEDIGLDFAKYMRTVLRQDPDTILIGEIRDDETARAAIEASKTGHLVFSTLHTNTSISTLLRLMGMGVAHADIAANIQGILAQQLVGTFSPEVIQGLNAPDLSEETLKLVRPVDGGLELNRLMRQDYFLPSSFSFYTDNNTEAAYSGRSAITELWAISDEARDMISSGVMQSEKYFPIALKGGMKPMMISGLESVARKNTSLDKISRTVGLRTFRSNAELIKQTLAQY